jgi:hypothetical protein
MTDRVVLNIIPADTATGVSVETVHTFATALESSRMPEPRVQQKEQLYRRQLPGGGFVAIEASRCNARFRSPTYRGEVIVERRADHGRRVGHAPPVVAAVEAASIDSVTDGLFRIAHSNAEIATRCLARGRSRSADSRPKTAWRIASALVAGFRFDLPFRLWLKRQPELRSTER